MAKNITLLGADYPDVPAIILPQTGGGNALFTDVSDTDATAADVMRGKKFYLPDGTLATGTFLDSPFGDNCTLMRDIADLEIALKDTGYNTWTPTTTSTLILPQSDYYEYIPCDMTSLEYIINFRITIDYKYTQQPVGEYIEKYACEILTYIYKRPGDYQKTLDADFNFTKSENNMNYMFTYATGTGYKNVAWGTSAGVYVTNPSETMQNNSYATTLVKPRIPPIRAMCVSPYFSTTSAGLVDKDNTKIKIKGYFLSYDKMTSVRSAMAHDLVNMHNNP